VEKYCTVGQVTVDNIIWRMRNECWINKATDKHSNGHNSYANAPRFTLCIHIYIHSGQSFWLQIQRSRVRSPALPDFLSGNGSGTGSTQPREVKLRSYLNKKSSGSRFRKQRFTAVGTHCANHMKPLYPQKLALTSPTGGGRSVGMVRLRTKATEFSLHTYICILPGLGISALLTLG